jgi:hypothetical protein
MDCLPFAATGRGFDDGSELRAGELLPHAADDHDAIRAARAAPVEADDIAGVQRVEAPRGMLVAHDDRALTAGEVRARVVRTLHADTAGGGIDGDDDEATLLKPVGEALGHTTSWITAGS